MTLILLSAAVTLLATLGLCAGALLGGRPLRGSCGGLSCGACRTSCPRNRDQTLPDTEVPP